MEWEAQKQRIFEHFGLAPRSPAQTATPEPHGGNTFGGGSALLGHRPSGVRDWAPRRDQG
jgi:nuclear pore complex protein Nup93